ncbi:DMT family transporter [Pseudomonas sp. LFM046]|uniref:DMT family transporter n=1 Tax=Pseudomonas sp. LFM046 TaxID=1608357 RepID=UPI0006990F71|nr:DMT family transporter [Pseudomonas sp. LFM046]
MNAAVDVRVNARILAILSICATAFFLASHDALAKRLTMEYPIALMVWVRYLVHFLVMGVTAAQSGGARAFHSGCYHLHFMRAACLVALSFCFIFGLRFIPLAEATAVNFLSPMFVLMLTVMFFSERVQGKQWFSVILGLAGVLLIVRPGGELFTPAILLPCAAAAFFSVYQVLTRVAGKVDSPTTSNLMVGLIGLLISSVLLPFFWVVPTGEGLALMILLGLMGTAAHLFLAHAYKLSSPALLAPFSYAQILFAGLLGFIFYGHIPDIGAIVGMVLIVVGGLLAAIRFK